jgi:hypothetical protein
MIDKAMAEQVLVHNLQQKDSTSIHRKSCIYAQVFTQCPVPDTILCFEQGVVEGKPRAYILEFRVDAVNRGAYIPSFSQYPAEIEYLFLPCSFIQPAGKPTYEFLDEGVVTMFSCQISVNFKAQTIGSLRAEKWDMHIAAFDYMLDELQQNLKRLANEHGRHGVKMRLASDTCYTSSISAVSNMCYNEDCLLGQIMLDCRVILQQHAGLCLESYINICIYQSLVMEMLDTKQHAWYPCFSR